jgi:hypothetical protein
LLILYKNYASIVLRFIPFLRFFGIFRFFWNTRDFWNGWSFELEKTGKLCSLSYLFHFACAVSFSQKYTYRDFIFYLVCSLIVLVFLYTDVVYFPSLTRTEFRKLELLFMHVRSMCKVFGADNISEFSRGILGYTLFENLELRLAGFIHIIDIVGAPDYLHPRLVLDRSSRHEFLVILKPVPITSLRGELRGDSAFYHGICLWNVLPSTVKSSFSIRNFKGETKRFLTTTLLIVLIIINFSIEYLFELDMKVI